MVPFLMLLTTSIIATGPPPSLAERILSPPARSHIFSTGKTLSFGSLPAKSFSTFRYSPTTTSASGLFYKKFPFNKKKIKPLNSAAAAGLIQVLSKKVFPLQAKKVIIKETMPSSPPLKTTKKLVHSNEQPGREKKLSSLPSSSSAAALDPLAEKMNKKMSLDDIRELLNRPR